MAIRRLRLAAFLGFLLLIAASVGVTFAALQTQRADALVINLAGRQRMLIQKMTLEVLGVQADADPLYRQQLRETEVVYFEQTLAALLNGGQAPHDGGALVTLPPTRNPGILAQLDRVRATWEEMDQAIHTILAAEPHSAEMDEAAATVMRLAPMVLSQMDEAVRLYEAEAARKVARVQAVQVGFLVIALALLAVSWFITERWVLGPIAQLGAAARRIGEGDLSIPVWADGPGEIEQLAVRFDEMRQNLAASRGEQARLYARAQERLERISALHDIDVAIVSHLDLQKRLDVLLEKVVERLRVDAAAVALIEADTKELVYAARRGLDGEFFANGFLKVKDGIAGRVAHSGEAVAIPDVRAEPRFLRREIAGRLGIVSYLAVPLRARGAIIGVLELAARARHEFLVEEMDFFVTLAGQAAIAIENSRMYESLANEQHNTARLYHLSLELTTNLDPEDVAKRALQAATDALGVSRGNILTVENDSENMRLLAETGYDRETINAINRRLNWNTSRGVTGHVIQTRTAAIVPDVSRDPFWVPIPGLDDWVKSMLSVPLVAGNDIVGVLNLLSEQPGFFKTENLSRIAAIASPVALALQNARLFGAERIAREQAESLREAVEAVGGTLDLDEMLRQILTQLKRMLPYDTASVLLLGEGGRPALVIGTGYADERQTSQSAGDLLADSRILRRMALDLQPALIADVRHHPDWIWVAGAGHVRTFLAVPIVARSRLIGALMIDSVQIDFFNESQIYLAQTLAQHMAIAIENARHYEDMRQRLKDLEILADTSSALRKAQSYSDIAPILLAKAVEGLNADAGVLLLLENDALKFTAIHGEINVAVGDTCPPDDTGMIWQALENDAPLFTPDISQIEEPHKSAVCQSLMGDALSCACVSLQTTTSAIGVVFLNWKKKSFLSADESRLLESLAEIAANALHRSTLHLQTVRQAQDLTLAYDATIEGWSRALDLRDKETEGHSQRVTELTLRLAHRLGMSEDELVHVRRGALLHDIGKMGIPDNILHKAGALSDEEWAMMRRHPQLAYELLSPIAYLQPALDIPFCHHEKWDGSGYPRGLKGEKIPLAARIFAVVDVFDALTSDRPYRPAWTKRKATAYIRQQAGIHFDPKVLSVFLKLIGRK